MNEKVRTDIIAVLKEALELIRKDDVAALKELSNHTIHNSSIFQDEDSISTAVIIYSLSKLLDRGVKVERRIEEGLKDMLEYVKNNNQKGFRSSIKRMLKIIGEADSKLKLYIGQVIQQAEIKKGSKIYEHGISMARAAELLGITQWELMSYVGKRAVPYTYGKDVPILTRLKFVRSLFK